MSDAGEGASSRLLNPTSTAEVERDGKSASLKAAVAGIDPETAALRVTPRRARNHALTPCAMARVAPDVASTDTTVPRSIV
jgi:hypothetical protein